MNKKISKKFTLIGASAALVASAIAYAEMPDNDEQIKYYSSATYTELVGTRTKTCSGSDVLVGKMTIYKRLVYREPCF